MSEHTPGPWIWYGNTKQHHVWLCTPNRGRLIVMDFVRSGMHRAKPRLRVDGIMFPADGMAETDHNNEFVEIDHPDARLIAAAPDLLKACQDALEYVDGRKSYTEYATNTAKKLRRAISRALGEKVEGGISPQ